MLRAVTNSHTKHSKYLSAARILHCRQIRERYTRSRIIQLIQTINFIVVLFYVELRFSLPFRLPLLIFSRRRVPLA